MCNLGGDAVILACHFVIDTLILIAIEMELFSCIKKLFLRDPPPRQQNMVLDKDVTDEEERVRKNTGDVIRVSDFRKAYQTALGGTSFLAVERISFGLDYGECFALLGVNGAGKSTTFKALTGDSPPSEG
jgi:ABC-type glutathione transport system ATPase component